MTKLARIVLLIVKVNECGKNWVHEDMQQVACMKTLILKSIYHVLKR